MKNHSVTLEYKYIIIFKQNGQAKSSLKSKNFRNNGLSPSYLMFFSNQKSFNHFTLPQMLLDNLINILTIKVAIPNLFRVDHQNRTKFATI